MNVKKFKIKIQKKLIFILVLINALWTWPLNLNNSCMKSSQFYKLLSLKKYILRNFDEKKIEMMLIDYPHSKHIHNLKGVKFETFKN